MEFVSNLQRPDLFVVLGRTAIVIMGTGMDNKFMAGSARHALSGGSRGVGMGTSGEIGGLTNWAWHVDCGAVVVTMQTACSEMCISRRIRKRCMLEVGKVGEEAGGESVVVRAFGDC